MLRLLWILRIWSELWSLQAKDKQNGNSQREKVCSFQWEHRPSSIHSALLQKWIHHKSSRIHHQLWLYFCGQNRQQLNKWYQTEIGYNKWRTLWTSLWKGLILLQEYQSFLWYLCSYWTLMGLFYCLKWYRVDDRGSSDQDQGANSWVLLQPSPEIEDKWSFVIFAINNSIKIYLSNLLQFQMLIHSVCIVSRHN